MTIVAWLPVAGFEGFYEVSDAGEVRSLRRGKILRPTKSSRYPTFHLYGDCTKATRYLHHLVAEAFLGPRPKGMDICHNNGNRLDARASNLRYDTKSANNRDAVLHGTHSSSGRTHCPHGHELAVVGTYKRVTRAADGGDKIAYPCIQCDLIRRRISAAKKKMV